MSSFKLNKEQQQAVKAPLGVQLVLAGAGSGKTQVLVQRVGYLVEHFKCSPHNILAVTFTNKAATEMKERIGKLLNQNVDRMWVGTFHGIANRLLRRHYIEAGLSSNFQILNSSDQKRIVKNVLAELEIDEKDLSLAKAVNYINSHKDEGIRPNNIQLNKFNLDERRLHEIYVTYETKCALSDVIDFAEILLRALELLQNQPAILQYYRNNFRHILVDEFQDTNSVQYAWLRLLADKNESLMVVGDDDQSIYGWRGAKIENIQNFSQDFPSCEIIRLEQNYRSTSVILNAANAVIAQNGRERLGKNLWTKQKVTGNKILLRGVRDERIEASRVAEEILQAQQNGTKLDDIVILYRTNAQSRELEGALRDKKIAYKIHGDTSFYNRTEIKNAMAYLAVISNPNNNAQLARIINFPPRAIGPKTIDFLQKTASEYQTSLWHAVNHAVEVREFAPRAQNSLEDFVIKIKDLQNKAKSLPLAELVNLMLSRSYSCLIEHYQSKKDDNPIERINNLNELLTAASNFAKEENHIITLQNFIDQNALFTEENNEEQEQTDQVHLMTVHRAKGLEFQHVIITGLEEGLFPAKDDIEEERRLFYVAITRAKKNLSLYYAENRKLYGKSKDKLIKSRFLVDIPTELLDLEPIKKLSEKKPFASFSLNSHRKHQKQQAIEQESTGKYRLGQSVYHAEYGEGLVFQTREHQVEVKINNTMYWLDENNPNLRPL